MKRIQHMLVLLDLWRELRRMERIMDADRIGSLEREVAALRTRLSERVDANEMRLAQVESFAALLMRQRRSAEPQA